MMKKTTYKNCNLQNYCSAQNPESGKDSKKIGNYELDIVLKFCPRLLDRTYLKITLKSGTKWNFLQRFGENHSLVNLKLCSFMKCLNLIG